MILSNILLKYLKIRIWIKHEKLNSIFKVYSIVL